MTPPVRPSHSVKYVRGVTCYFYVYWVLRVELRTCNFTRIVIQSTAFDIRLYKSLPSSVHGNFNTDLS